MFTPVILLLIFICFNYSKSDTDPELTNVECVTDSKVKQACSILTFDAEGNPVYQFIKNHKCKKNKKCLAVNGVKECSKNGKCYASFKTCQDVIEPKLKDEDCNYKEECKSRLCQNHKCTSSVSQENDTCVNSYSCPEGGFYCNSNTTCKKLKKGNETCEDGDMCELGYICNNTCILLRSLSPGIYTKYPELCTTGISENNKCSTNSTKQDIFDAYVEKYYSEVSNSSLNDKNFRLTAENMFHWEKTEVKTAYYKYENYYTLSAFGIIDSKGDNKSNSCEFKFLFNKNNRKYISVPFMFLSLLFLLSF